MPPLSIHNARKIYRQGNRQIVALDDVSLDIQQGQFLAVMGASGSGKSTLLHLMAGLTALTAGSIRINGHDLAGMSDHQLTLFRRRSIGLVFQAFNLIPTLTAEQNVALPLVLDGQSARQARDRALPLLEQLGLAERATHRPDALSGGEQQRVAIARALVTNPVIVLADEPTGNLDSANSRHVCELLRDLCAKQGKTIAMVTHEPSVACYASEVVVLRDGRQVDRFAAQESGDALAQRYHEALRQG